MQPSQYKLGCGDFKKYLEFKQKKKQRTETQIPIKIRELYKQYEDSD